MKSLKASLVAGALLFTMTEAQAAQKTICGEVDDRLPSNNPMVARSIRSGDNGGCTLTMIGKACAISAGHCHSTFEIAQFNTPMSQNGRIGYPAPEDSYEVDKSSITYRNGGMGNDYAVLRLLPNSVTGKLAGDAQGYYPVSFTAPNIGDIVRITGYGLDTAEPDRNLAQQSHIGPIANFSTRGGGMGHQVDTMGGNSGSSIILEDTGEIIGIHTHGGCYTRGGANGSTSIAHHPELQKAITACLEWEADNL